MVRLINDKNMDFIANTVYSAMRLQEHFTHIYEHNNPKISPCIYVMWHANQLLVHGIEDKAHLSILISNSIDGEIVAPNGERRDEWKGGLAVHNGGLTSLEGAPKKVSGYFYCSGKKRLTSLVGGPEEVGGGYSCDSCDLTSLEGAPKKVGGNFFCDRNKRLT